MRECPQMEWLASRLGEELSEADRDAVQRHVAACDLCQVELRRLDWIARRLAELEPAPAPPSDHLSDLDLATFAVRGHGPDEAAAAVGHLAECNGCRRELAAVRVALDQYTELFGDEAAAGPPVSSWQQLQASLRLAVSTRRRAALATAALLCYLGECLGFAFAATQLLFRYVLSPTGYHFLPLFWPLYLIGRPPLLLGAVVLACTLVALGLRWCAGRLYRAAVRPEGGAG